MYTVYKSDKLQGVCYDIRGPVQREATRLEEEGHRILKLNIGNPTPFGFDAPDEIMQAAREVFDKRRSVTGWLMKPEVTQ